MRFSVDKAVKIVMLGAGGTGGHVAPHIYRLLHTLDRRVRIIIADGDTVEEKNLVRQNFISADLGRNKAQVLAERYATAFGLEAQYIPGYIESEKSLASLIKPDIYPVENHPYRWADELSILIGAVDNNKSRQLCHRVFNNSDDLIYIDSGNGEFTGQVVCGIRRKGKTYYKPIGDAYPDVLSDTDKFPTELSCAEAAVSAPQSIAANIMAAASIVSYLYNILILGNIETRSVTFSTKTVNLKPIITQKRKRKAVGVVSKESQKRNMKTIHSLVSQNLSYIHGERECGPNGAKKQFLTKSAAFLRALGNDLGFNEMKVKTNPGGIAVSGDISLMGLWRDGNGLYLQISQPVIQPPSFLYREIAHIKDYRGGHNRWLSCSMFEDGDYDMLVSTLSSLKKPAEVVLHVA